MYIFYVKWKIKYDKHLLFRGFTIDKNENVWVNWLILHNKIIM